jgi:putative DNA primase/helicase
MDARAITQALGGMWHGHYGLCRCPVHADSNPSLKVSDSDCKGIDVHCFAGCDWKGVKNELRRQGLLNDNFSADIQSHPKVIAEPDEDINKNIGAAQSLWRTSVPLPGTLGETYFVQQRKLPIDKIDLEHAVRYHPVHRMVVALMTNPVTNEPCGVHRTLLDVNGKKRERKMLGRQGVVRITPDEDVTYGLGIAEGIEDAIAVALEWGPAWAATSAGAIERFPVLCGIDCINIFTDADAAGTKAASACAAHWIAAGKEAQVLNL